MTRPATASALAERSAGTLTRRAGGSAGRAGGATGRGGRRRLTDPVPGPPRALRALLPIRIRYVIGWEIALLATLVAYAHRDNRYGTIVLTGVAAAALLLIGLTSIRRHELTGAERLVAHRRMRQRNQVSDRGFDSPRHRLLAGLTLNTHIDRAGNRTGVVGAGNGWSALIKISDTATPDPAAVIDAASRACLRARLPLAAAQVVTLNVPGGWRGDATPPVRDRTLRQYFVAVRTAEDPSRLAALARGGGAGGAQRATASAAAALAHDLTQLGYPCAVLDIAELDQQLQLLAGTTNFEGQPVGQPPVQLLETKDAWSSGRMQQSCLRVGAGTGVTAALTWTVRQPLSFVIASCTLTPSRQPGLQRDFVIRAGMISQPGPLTVEQAARTLDRGLVPLRYRQQKYLRATLPLALPAAER